MNKFSVISGIYGAFIGFFIFSCGLNIYNMYLIKDTFDKAVEKSTLDSNFLNVVSSMYMPESFMQVLIAIFIGMIILFLLSSFAYDFKKKIITFVVLALSFVFLGLSSYNTYHSYSDIDDKYKTLQTVYNDTQKEMAPFDKQLYNETFKIYDKYTKDKNIDNKVKFDAAYFSTVFIKDFLRELNTEELQFFQHSLKADIEFTINNEKAYRNINLIFLVTTIHLLISLIIRHKTITVQKEE